LLKSKLHLYNSKIEEALNRLIKHTTMNLTFSPSQILLYGIAIAAGLIYFPYIFVAFGRVSIGYDMNSPRAMFDRLPDYAKRATWAHQNSFEVFALFAAAALTAYVSNAASDKTSLYVLAFLAARFLFSLFYILDLPWLRSPMWGVSMACVGSLFIASLT
jgi:uncharacterized MAPEG superfamily protein